MWREEIWHGDCLGLMPDIPEGSVDMILTDLPYGVTSRCAWDEVIPFEPMWAQFKRVLKPSGVAIIKERWVRLTFAC